MGRTCGLDVHKHTIFCRIFTGNTHNEAKEYLTLTSSIQLMVEKLLADGIK
ncbi:MAG TPA: hypothetical protein P5250_00365 [Bacteroidales bacterium]|nr:hypothetical protein [Bacteroidales bacterium]